MNFTIDNIRFSAINRQAAQDILKDLHDFEQQPLFNVTEDYIHFPGQQDKAVFLLCDEAVNTDSLTLDRAHLAAEGLQIDGFIFTKSLTVKKFIITKNEVAFIALDHVQTTNLEVTDTIHYIGKGIKADTIIGRGETAKLIVKGETDTWLVFSDLMKMYFEKFSAVASVVSKATPSIFVQILNEATQQKTMIQLPNAHKLSNIIYNEFIVPGPEQNIGNQYFESIFQHGFTLINQEKKEKFTYEKFADDIKLMFNFLAQFEDVKQNGAKAVLENDRLYTFQNFKDEGKDYQQLGVIYQDLGVQFRCVKPVGINDIDLNLEYIDAEGKILLNWEGKPSTNNLFMRIVMRNIYEGYQKLKV